MYAVTPEMPCSSSIALSDIFGYWSYALEFAAQFLFFCQIFQFKTHLFELVYLSGSYFSVQSDLKLDFQTKHEFYPGHCDNVALDVVRWDKKDTETTILEFSM